MSTLNPNDVFLVQQNGVTKTVLNENRSTLDPENDIFLVQRSGVTHTIKAGDVGGGVTGYFDTPVEVLTPLNGAGLNAGETYQPTSSVITGGFDGTIIFQDDTELENIIGPVRMVDENGEVKTPVTSAIDSVTPVAANSLFSTKLYPGTGNTQQITTGIDNTDKSLVWLKATDNSTDHCLFDTIRGVNNFISSNKTGGDSGVTSLTAFNSDGFDLANFAFTNTIDQNYVAWNFRAAPGFMDIVTYLGDGIQNRAVPHSLGTVPGMIIVKDIDNTGGWYVWHKDSSPAWEGSETAGDGSGGNQTGSLELNTAEDLQPNIGLFTYQNDTAFGVYYSQLDTNVKDSNYVAYLFADTPGKIKCDKIELTNTSAKTIDVGFKPGWLLLKRTDSDQNWFIVDSKRPNEQGGQASLQPNTAEVEDTGNDNFVFTETGFTLTTNFVTSGSSYIYVAIAEDAGDPASTELTLTTNQDLKYLKAGDVVTAPGSTTQTAAFTTTLYQSNNTTTLNVPTGIDNTSKSLIWIKNRDISSDHFLTYDDHSQYLISNEVARAVSNDAITPLSNGFDCIRTFSGTNSATNNFVAWNFKAAPQFMDIVTWDGTGVPKVVPHALGSEPAFIITKSTSIEGSWYSYHKDIPSPESSFLVLDLPEKVSGPGRDTWDNTLPTSSGFSVGPQGYNTNNSGEKYVAYLFADTPGTIKCGEYLGNSGNNPIECGFKPEFVLIKCTTTSASWCMHSRSMDLEYLRADENVAKQNAGGYFEWTETGFKLTQAGTAWNASPNNYIYVAIAEGATAGSFSTTGTLLTDADPSAKTMQVDTAFSTGQILTGPELDTVSNNVVGQSGDTLSVTDTTGTWFPGLFAEGATITASAPSPESIVFTSMNDGTTPVTGLDVSLGRRVWTLETSDSKSGPWTVVGTYPDDAANASQDGATPWGNPTLEANTFYQVKVKYESANADDVESIYNTFKTGDA